MNKYKSRLERLEREISPKQRRPSWISISDEDWDRLQAGKITKSDLGIERSTKVYIGISPDDWD